MNQNIDFALITHKQRYWRGFEAFDGVLVENSQVLTVTAFAALVVWLFFSAMLYYTERDNPDPEMSAYYTSIPVSMWMTLLNLNGESPLCDYTALGKNYNWHTVKLFVTALIDSYCLRTKT